MKNTEIQNAILAQLYQARFLRTSLDDLGIVNLRALCEQQKWDTTEYAETVEYMTRAELICIMSVEGYYAIRAAGVVDAESNVVIPTTLIETNQRIRRLILDALLREFEQNGPFYGLNIDELQKATGLDERALWNNSEILEYLGLTESDKNSNFRLTSFGLQEIEKLRGQRLIQEEFQHIKDLNPHERGHEFQKWFAKCVELEGWVQEEGLRLPGEELDVIINRGHEYYLVECKWEQDPVGEPVIRDFFGKLFARAGVNGLAISMSGFAETGEVKARELLPQRIILLFGPEEVNSIAAGKEKFDTLLNEKFKSVVTRRKIVWR